MKMKQFVLFLAITTIISIVLNCAFLYYGVNETREHNAIAYLVLWKAGNAVVWLPIVSYVIFLYVSLLFTGTVYDRKRRRVVTRKDMIFKKIKEVVGIK